MLPNGYIAIIIPILVYSYDFIILHKGFTGWRISSAAQ